MGPDTRTRTMGLGGDGVAACPRPPPFVYGHVHYRGRSKSVSTISYPLVTTRDTSSFRVSHGGINYVVAATTEQVAGEETWIEYTLKVGQNCDQETLEMALADFIAWLQEDGLAVTRPSWSPGEDRGGAPSD